MKTLTDPTIYFDSDYLTMICRCRHLKSNVSTRPNWDLRVGAPTRPIHHQQKTSTNPSVSNTRVPKT